ncbi:MAG: hypothetical protein C0468_02425 [Planctomyces sp.]|nr:hypothetical protein [Planctomyces sp.]
MALQVKMPSAATAAVAATASTELRVLTPKVVPAEVAGVADLRVGDQAGLAPLQLIAVHSHSQLWAQRAETAVPAAVRLAATVGWVGWVANLLMATEVVKAVLEASVAPQWQAMAAMAVTVVMAQHQVLAGILPPEVTLGNRGTEATAVLAALATIHH